MECKFGGQKNRTQVEVIYRSFKVIKCQMTLEI